jgi:hypothetical protein
MEQEYLICGGQSLCILGIPIIRHHYSVIGLLMCPRCGNLLNGFIPHRLSVELALERYTNTIFFGYNVNALVTALHRHTCIPSDTAQLVGRRASAVMATSSFSSWRKAEATSADWIAQRGPYSSGSIRNRMCRGVRLAAVLLCISPRPRLDRHHRISRSTILAAAICLSSARQQAWRGCDPSRSTDLGQTPATVPLP